MARGCLPMSWSLFADIDDFLFRAFHTELDFLFSLSRPTEWDTTSMMWLVSIVHCPDQRLSLASGGIPCISSVSLHDNYVDLSVF